MGIGNDTPQRTAAFSVGITAQPALSTVLLVLPVFAGITAALAPMQVARNTRS